jgi:predicted nuclease of predicted toxin-antitoxin system
MQPYEIPVRPECRLQTYSSPSQLGHDVQVVSRNYPLALPDEDILEIARKEKRILVVADRDFGELIFQQGLAHAGVIFFRLPGAKLQTKIDQLIFHQSPRL